MAQDDTQLFVAIALEKGLLNREQADQCRDAAAQAAQIGINVSLAKVAQDRGFLSPEQIRDIRREMTRRGAPVELGKYRIVAKLGEGGMGAVYKAEDTRLKRTVALKVLPRERAADPDYVARFQREARLAGKIQHPNAVAIYETGQAGGLLFIAMEFVDGMSADRLLNAGPLDERRALKIVRGIAAALRVAHEHGIVHRDIKPANILLTKDDEPKLADLGIARQAGAASVTLTKTGTTVGTAHYMSPEQCRGVRDIDGRADIYSLGATLFHFVCGRTPFDADTTTSVMYQQVHEPLPEPRGINPTLSPGVADLIIRMMAKDRAERIQTCADLMREVDALTGDGEVSHDAASTPASRRSLRVGVIVGAVLVATALALIAITATSSRSRHAAEQAAALPTSPISGPAASASAERVDTDATITPTGEAAPPAVPAAVTQAPHGAAEDVPMAWPFDAAEANRRQKEAEAKVELPKGWNRETRHVTVATPQGNKALDITYYKNTIGMEFVLVPAGEYVMGKPGEHGPHVLVASIFVGTTEVTQQEYVSLVKGNVRAAREPVGYTNMLEAAGFIQALRKREGLAYRLPTGAEWEYACRAGSDTRFYWGDEMRADCAWYWGNSGGRRHVVGLKLPNSFGLYDMLGNMTEWCSDRASESQETGGADPIGEKYLLRGGSWTSLANPKDIFDSQFAYCFESETRSVGALGFRVVCSASERVTSTNAGEAAQAKPVQEAAVPATTWPFDAAEANRRQKEAEKSVDIPKGWTKETRRVTVATPKGGQPLAIIYYKNTIGMEFVFVPAGEFMMGSPADEKGRFEDEGPQHRVSITGSFYLGNTEVTQAQWQAVMGSNPSRFKGAGNPVEMVSWDDCQEFMSKLCAREGLPPGTYRLPTEAEREYACRAGTATDFYSGGADTALDAVGWYDGNSGKTTHPVRAKKPNGWGLYDMHGNVWEWCADWYTTDYYLKSPSSNPQGPATGGQRVLRGGGWYGKVRHCRSANRDRYQPDARSFNFGFRAVVVIPPWSDK